MTETSGAKVTLAVIPRERWGVAQESLESIYATADLPFELLYVECKSPSRHRTWLVGEAERRGFRLLCHDHFLSPNEARNAAIRAATTPYIVFIDNDVICAEGWLSRLVATAEETDADVVGPLICDGVPLHNRIHQAGAIFAHDPPGFFQSPPGTRVMADQMLLAGEPVSTAPTGPVETQVCEFHCMLVRRDVFDRVGLLDEELLALDEHIDFCMGVVQAGGRVLLEPRAVVTYLFPCRARPMTLEDWPYFLVRWSEGWQRRSLDRLTEKWGLDPAQHGLAERRSHTRWRYDDALVKPLLRKLALQDAEQGLRRQMRRQVRRLLSQAVAIGGAALTNEADDRRMAAREKAKPAVAVPTSAIAGATLPSM